MSKYFSIKKYKNIEKKTIKKKLFFFNLKKILKEKENNIFITYWYRFETDYILLFKFFQFSNLNYMINFPNDLLEWFVTINRLGTFKVKMYFMFAKNRFLLELYYKLKNYKIQVIQKNLLQIYFSVLKKINIPDQKKNLLTQKLFNYIKPNEFLNKLFLFKDSFFVQSTKKTSNLTYFICNRGIPLYLFDDSIIPVKNLNFIDPIYWNPGRITNYEVKKQHVSKEDQHLCQDPLFLLFWNSIDFSKIVFTENKDSRPYLILTARPEILLKKYPQIELKLIDVLYRLWNVKPFMLEEHGIAIQIQNYNILHKMFFSFKTFKNFLKNNENKI